MKKRLFSLVLASAMVLGALTACGGSKKETKAETTATETTAAADESSESAGDKILRVASEDPQVPLDMQLNTYSLIMKITDNTTESLLLTNPQGELETTLLAEMPTLSDDKLTYSFTLKEGVTFHNGAIYQMHKFLDQIHTQMVGVAGLAGRELHGHAAFGLASQRTVYLYKIVGSDTRAKIYNGFLFIHIHNKCLLFRFLQK